MSERIKGPIARYWAVAAIALLAVATRMAYLAFMQGTPAFEWIDPDGYVDMARTLIGHDGEWRWNTQAVRYFGPFVKAPLYQVMLSSFAYSPIGYQWSAGVSHAILAGVTVLALWSLVRDLHSEKAAFIAAVIYALYFPSVVSVNAIMQERLYVPLLATAFALLAWALRTPDRPWRCVLAGVVLGGAALTRSMPVYFVGPAALLVVFTEGDRRRGMTLAALFLAGFLAIVIPYSLFVSSKIHQFVLIENVGAYGIARLDPVGREYFAGSNVDAPSIVQIIQFTWHRFLENPAAFCADKLNSVAGNFKLGGARWLDAQGILPTAATALMAKIAAHSLGDALFVTFVLASPFGFIAARRRAAAALLVLWIVIHLGMTAMSGYAGQRFREPIDWALLGLAAGVLVGGWSTLTRRHVLCCLPVAMVMAWVMLASVEDSIPARADYGISPWSYSPSTRVTVATGAAGFKVPVNNGAIDVRLRTIDADHEVTLEFLIDGHSVGKANVGGEGYRLRVPYRKARAFVELQATPSDRNGLEIEVDR